MAPALESLVPPSNHMLFVMWLGSVAVVESRFGISPHRRAAQRGVRVAHKVRCVALDLLPPAYTLSIDYELIALISLPDTGIPGICRRIPRQHV